MTEDGIVCYQAFFNRIQNDPRIGISHLAVFAALFYLWSTNNHEAVIKAFSWEIMAVAKISTQGTYFRILHDLSRYGYIKYTPSQSKHYPSMIELGHSV